MPDSQLLVVIVCRRPRLRDALRASFEARDVAVSVVSTSREVLITLETHEVAAIVIHDDLPLGDALSLSQAVRRHQLGTDVAIVFLTVQPWSASRRAVAIQDLSLVDVVDADGITPDQVAALVMAEFQGPISRVPSSTQASALDERLAGPASHAERRQVEVAAAALQEETPSLRGNLQDEPFPELLHRLYRQRATGALFLLRDNIKKIVYFREGHPIYVKSNLLSECLGNVLVREKMITQEECEVSLAKMRQTRRQQGTVLIDMGSISPQNLVFGLERQLQTKLFDVFGWSGGEYLFKTEAKLPSEVVLLELSNAALIAEGVRRTWDVTRLESALAGSLDRYLIPAKDPELRFQHLSLDEMEQTFRDGIDGTVSLRELVASSPISNRRALALAYVLIVTGVVELLDGPVKKRRSDGEDVSEDVRVRQRLSQELLSLRSRDVLGILGVSVGSSDLEVEQAYSHLARDYHPDRFRYFSSDTRQLAREIFGLLYDAFTEIDTEEKRRFLREGSSHQDLEDISEVGRRSLLAEEYATRARHLMGQENWQAAQEALIEAVAQCGEAGDLLAMLGWVTYCLDADNPARLREAISLLRRAIELDARDENTYLYLGRIYAAIGRTILAEKQFERAVQCNPGCDEALDRLELTQERRRRRRTGTFSKILDVDDGS